MFQRLTQRLNRLCQDERGVTALEYGVIAAAIIVTGLALMPTLATSLNGVFNTINGALPGA